jgi:hypothetical protein
VFSQRNKKLLVISYKLNKTTMSHHWASLSHSLGRNPWVTNVSYTNRTIATVFANRVKHSGTPINYVSSWAIFISFSKETYDENLTNVNKTKHPKKGERKVESHIHHWAHHQFFWNFGHSLC